MRKVDKTLLETCSGLDKLMDKNKVNISRTTETLKKESFDKVEKKLASLLSHVANLVRADAACGSVVYDRTCYFLTKTKIEGKVIKCIVEVN